MEEDLPVVGELDATTDVVGNEAADIDVIRPALRYRVDIPADLAKMSRRPSHSEDPLHRVEHHRVAIVRGKQEAGASS